MNLWRKLNWLHREDIVTDCHHKLLRILWKNSRELWRNSYEFYAENGNADQDWFDVLEVVENSGKRKRRKRMMMHRRLWVVVVGGQFAKGACAVVQFYLLVVMEPIPSQFAKDACPVVRFYLFLLVILYLFSSTHHTR